MDPDNGLAWLHIGIYAGAGGVPCAHWIAMWCAVEGRDNINYSVRARDDSPHGAYGDYPTVCNIFDPKIDWKALIPK